MKKTLSIALSLLMIVSLFACMTVSAFAEDESEIAQVKESGKLVVGITDFEPMDYKGPDGSWIGFDADLATAFADALGVDVEFVEIDWDNKILELDGKSIDCVWNGMTLTDEVKASMSVSDPYCKNAQVIVVPADKAADYQTAEACKDLQFAVEAGSAGQEVAEENGFSVTEVKDQATALQEVAAGTSDAAIIDLLMAGAMIGEGTGFSGLTYTAALNEEEYGVGFRKGSDLVTYFNTFYASEVQSGNVDKVAEQYGISVDTIIK